MTSIHAELLNDLDRMARHHHYALQRETLQEAEQLIVSQEREINRLKNKLVEFHGMTCTAENCNLDGGPEHMAAFPGAK